MDWRHYPPLERRLQVFTPPPRTITDAAGRTIDFRVYGDGPVADEDEALVELYRNYPLEHRSLGLPPIGGKRIRSWLDVLLAGHSVLAWHGDRVVGQAALVESGEAECELSVFVDPAYHGARIGTRLTETLLSYGKQQGVERVWLLVERSNYLAVNLYHEVGFFVTANHGWDVEMAINL